MIEWNSEERERYSNVAKYAYPNVVTFSQICSMMSQRLIDVFFRFLSLSHFQDKLLPPRIERESDESDEDESPKSTPLRFQHRDAPNSTERDQRDQRDQRGHRNHRDQRGHRNHRNHHSRRDHRHRRDDSDDLDDSNDRDDSNDGNEGSNGDYPDEVVAISEEGDTPFAEGEQRRRQRRLTMGQTLERGLYGFSLLLKRWLRVIGHFACRRGIGR